MKIKVKFTSEDMNEFTIIEELESFEEAKDLISSPYYAHWDRAFILNADTDEVIKEYKYIYPDIPGSNKRVCEVYDSGITFQASNLFLAENEEYEKLFNKAKEIKHEIRRLKYRCNHTKDNMYTFHVDKNGNTVCPLCGEIFNPNCVDKDYVAKAAYSIKNICNTVKMLAAFSNCEEIDIEKIADIMALVDELPDMYSEVHGEFDRTLKQQSNYHDGMFGKSSDNNE